MRTIYKFPIPADPGQHKITMPAKAQIISSAVVNDKPVIYAIVDTNQDTEKRKIAVYYTGEEVNEYDLDFIGTLQMNNGIVLHVFENK